MNHHRRYVLQGLAAASTMAMVGRHAWGAGKIPLKISHQFPRGVRDRLPGGIVTEGDFRDRLCRRFESGVDKRTNGVLDVTVYPNSTLLKAKAQFDALRDGTLDLSLVPISYAGDKIPEMNIGLMPGLVASYDQGRAWKNAEVGKLLTRLLDDLGIVIVSWIWQAGGVASREKPLIGPEDAKGMKVRGGSEDMNLVLKAAGASIVTMPSNEIYVAMKTGELDAAMTSSTSLISFNLQEIAKHLTTGRGRAYWFMFEPLLMSKAVFTRLSPAQRDAIMSVGAELETFALEAAKADDRLVADVYLKSGAKVYDLDDAIIKRWRAIARNTAWKNFAGRSANCAKLLALAEKTL